MRSLTIGRSTWRRVETARKDWVVFRVLEGVAATEPNLRLALFLALVKFDRFELALEKATELGVPHHHAGGNGS